MRLQKILIKIVFMVMSMITVVSAQEVTSINNGNISSKEKPNNLERKTLTDPTIKQDIPLILPNSVPFGLPGDGFGGNLNGIILGVDGFYLQGILWYEGDSAKTKALINNDSFKVGEEVADGFMLTKINTDNVVIFNKSTKKTIKLKLKGQSR